MKTDQLFYKANVMVDPALIPYYERLHLPAGEGLIFEGEVSTDYYVVESGTLSVVEGTGESSLALAELGEGDVFGELSFFDGEPRSATVRAETDCTILRMSREQLVKIVESDVELGVHALIALGIRAAARVRTTNDVIAGILGKKDLGDNKDLKKIIRDIRASTFTKGKWWQKLMP